MRGSHGCEGRTGRSLGDGALKVGFQRARPLAHGFGVAGAPMPSSLGSFLSRECNGAVGLAAREGEGAADQRATRLALWNVGDGKFQVSAQGGAKSARAGRGAVLATGQSPLLTVKLGDFACGKGAVVDAGVINHSIIKRIPTIALSNTKIPRTGCDCGVVCSRTPQCTVHIKFYSSAIIGCCD